MGASLAADVPLADTIEQMFLSVKGWRAAADARRVFGLGRAMQEIEDPGEVATMVARLANASARTARANVVIRKERGKS